MKRLFRYFSVLPALLMLFLIFGFSAQDGTTSGSLSLRICLSLAKLTDRIFSSGLSDTELLSRAESMQFLVRKAAHVTEYLLLTLSIYLPFCVFGRTKRSANGLSETEENDCNTCFPVSKHKRHPSCFLRQTLLLFALAVLCAALDEFHQSFVPGRCGTPLDVLVDSIGILIGCAMIRWVTHVKNKRAATQQ